VSPFDLLLVAWVLVFGLSGLMRGLAAQVVSLAGVGLGIVLGAWLAPHVLSDAADAAWVPLASLVGAAAGAFLAGLVTGRFAARAHATLAANRVTSAVDRAGGAVGGVVVGLALAWALAILFLHQPGLGLRQAVQRSAILPALVRAVPPEPLLRTLERLDPFPILQLGPGRLPEPDPSVLQSPEAAAARASVVRVEGSSCGLGVRGSGWVVRDEIVATNAHVVSGQHDTQVLVPNVGMRAATIVYLDARNDVALLRVPGLGAPPLAVATGEEYPRPVVLLGYPGGGPLVARPGTVGRPRVVFAPNAYERDPAARTVVPLRGEVRHGQSGGPVVARNGRVVAMVFGGSRGGDGGFGVPVELVLRAFDDPLRPVDPGPCVG
jgi:S1-C subfamily serine protease